MMTHEETPGRPKFLQPPRGADDGSRWPGGALLPQRLVCSALAAAVLLSMSACQTSGPVQPGGQVTSSTGAPLTSAEQRMRQDESRFNDTVIGGVLTGAAAGAVAGVLAGILTGGNKKEIRNAAIGGAVIGGVAGGIDGYVTAKKEQAGRDEIRALQAAAADVRQDNNKLQAFLDSSGTVLAEGKARLAALRGDVAAKRLSAEQAQAARQREEQNIASMNTTLAQARKTRDQYAQASKQFSGTPQAKRDLDGEIARMNKQVAQLEGNINEYNRALAVSPA